MMVIVMDFKAGAELTTADLLYYGASHVAEMQCRCAADCICKENKQRLYAAVRYSLVCDYSFGILFVPLSLLSVQLS